MITEFRDFLFKIIFVPVGEATCHVKFLEAAIFLFIGIFQDGVDRFFLGEVDKATGIDHNHRSMLAGLMLNLKLVSFELGFDYFGINYIFAASECDDLNFLRMNGFSAQEINL